MRLVWVLSVTAIFSVALALWGVIYVVAAWIQAWVR